MTFDIDVAIFLSFLFINLFFGVLYSGKIKTLEEYAIGHRNFSTSAIISTLVATWISGSFLFVSIGRMYSDGITMIAAYLLFPSIFLLMGYVFIPRMGEFFGRISVADAMGSIYGKKIELITSITGAISCLGMVAVQFKIFSTLFTLFLDINNTVAVLLSSIIVIIYTTFGGIKSVTLTDIIQFITFSIFIPCLLFLLIQDIDINHIVETISDTHFADFDKLFDYKQAGFFSFITMVFYFSFPNFPPEIFQRILIANNIMQIRKSFFASFYICLVMVIVTVSISITIFYINPNLSSDKLVNFVINNYLSTGLKGLTVIGILAMTMSSADSNINASAILITNIFKQFYKKNNSSIDLMVVRIVSLILSLFAVGLALSFSNLLELILTTACFYLPVVNIPLMMTILGFRSTAKSVLIGMGAGFLTVILFMLSSTKTSNSIIPAMTVNFIFLLGSHYMLRQSGGWIGVKDSSPLIELKNKRKQKITEFVKCVKEFNIIKVLIKNTPNEDKLLCLFGVFCLVTTLATTYSISRNILNYYQDNVFLIFQIMLILSTYFMLYPVWPYKMKTPIFVSVIWHVSLVYILVFCSTYFVILSDLHRLQLIVFTLNMIIIFVLSNWRIGLILLILGVFLGIKFYEYIRIEDSFSVISQDIYFNLLYIFLIISTTLISVLKPKQEQFAATETKANNLENKVVSLEKEKDYFRREFENISY